MKKKKVSIDPKTRLYVSEYDDETREKAISLYLISGSIKKAGMLSGVPYRTLQHWKTTQWWNEKLVEAKRKYTNQLDSRFTGLLQHISKQLEDRILNGDWTVTMQGERVRQPIKAAELSRIGDSIFKSLQLIRGEATSNVRTLEPEEKLDKIREKLMSNKKLIDDKQDEDHALH